MCRLGAGQYFLKKSRVGISYMYLVGHTFWCIIARERLLILLSLLLMLSTLAMFSDNLTEMIANDILDSCSCSFYSLMYICILH